MDVARLFERGPDAADAPVHHVRRRDDVYARSGLRQRLLDQHFERDVVDDVAAGVDHAVLAVRSVGVERDVGHDAELGEALLELRDGARHQSAGVVGLATVERLELLLDDGEQRQGGNAKLETDLGLPQQPVDRHALDPRHRGHLFGAILAVEHEHRIDQVICGKHAFAHQPARELVAPHAPHAHRGKAAEHVHGCVTSRD